MNIHAALFEMRTYLADLNRAIQVFEVMMIRGRESERGCPPAGRKAAASKKKRGRPPGSKNKPKGPEGTTSAKASGE